MESLKESPNQESPESDLELNDLLDCESIRPHELWIHISEAKGKSPGEIKTLFKEGLTKLASLLESDQKFREIHLITGTSWLVISNPDLVEKFGFTIVKEGEEYEAYIKEYGKRKEWLPAEYQDLPVGHCHITREKFIELYNE